MNLKKIFIMLGIIVLLSALMLPVFVLRTENESKNNDIVFALNYNNAELFLNKKELDSAIEKNKKAGVHTVIIGEESVNSLKINGDVEAIKFNELKSSMDKESSETAKELKNNPNIHNDSYIIISKSESGRKLLHDWVDKKYKKSEYRYLKTASGEDAYALYYVTESIGLVPIGFNEEKLRRARDEGFDIALSMMVSDYKTTEYAKKLDKLIKEYDVKYLNLKKNPSIQSPAKNEDENTAALLKILTASDITLIVTENQDQLSNQKPFGYDKYIEAADGRVIRGYETTDKESDDSTENNSRYYQMLNSVVDRNDRFVSVNLLTNGKNSIEDKSNMTVGATKRCIDKLEKFGYNTKSFNTRLSGYNTPRKRVYAVAAVIIILMWLVLIELALDKSLKILEIIFAAACVFAVALTAVLPKTLLQLYPSVFAVTAPCFCVTVVITLVHKMKEKPTALIIALSAFAALLSICLCGFIQITLLSGLDYYINTLLFRGIKLSLITPVVYTALLLCYRYSKETKENIWGKVLKFINSDIKVSYLIIGAAAVLIGMIYIKRSGNVQKISAFEAFMRNTITEYMSARPRTKEFLLGWPALVIFIYYVKNTNIRFLQNVFAIMSSILFASGINSFCHVFTPARVIYMRVLNGLLLGAAVSVVAYTVNILLVKLVKNIIKAGKKNGILSD